MYPVAPSRYAALSDVAFSALSDLQTARYDAGTGKWRNVGFAALPGNQSANLVFAGPSSGGPGATLFRSLVAADIPALSLSKISDAGSVASHAESEFIRADGSRAFAADQSLGGHKLTNLGDPSSAQDAVTKAYLDLRLIGEVVYQGTWNAATNTPTLASGVGINGQYYRVSAAGTTTIDGVSSWGVGDLLLFNGVIWEKIDNQATDLSTVALLAPASSARNVMQPTGAGIVPLIIRQPSVSPDSAYVLLQDPTGAFNRYSFGQMESGSGNGFAVRPKSGFTGHSVSFQRASDGFESFYHDGALTTTIYNLGVTTDVAVTGIVRTNSIYGGGGSGVIGLTGGPVGIGTSSEFGSAVGTVLALANATTAPTTNPSGGGVLYSQGGALKWKDSSGVVTAISPGNVILSREFYQGGDVLTAGVPLRVVCPFAGTITSGTVLLDQTGSVSIEVRKCTYAQFDGGVTHPVAGDKISASTPLAVSSATKSTDSTLTGWTTSVGAGDIIEFYLSSASAVTLALVQLLLTRV